MSELRNRIAKGDYEVDSARVAEAIVNKARLVRRVRLQLLANPYRQVEEAAFLHRDRFRLSAGEPNQSRLGR